MKSLQTVQKIVKVLKTLSLIALIACLIGMITCLIGAAIIFAAGAAPAGSALARMMEDMGYAIRRETCGELLASAVLCLCGGILSGCANRYFTHVLAAGTPFTRDGARELQQLGVKYLLLPIAAIIAAGLICAFFQTSLDYVGNEAEVSTGIAFILLSCVFRYGAELEDKCKETEKREFIPDVPEQ